MGTLKISLALLVMGCASGRHMQQPDPPRPAHHHQHEHKGPIGHRFEKADDWVPMFDDPARDEWQKPDAVISALALAPGMTVADVGAGTGYFTMRLARAVGPSGRVLAVDVEPDMVRYLGERAQRENLTNVTPVLGTATDPKLAAPVDRVLVVDTWHHIPDRVDYATKLSEALAPGGALVVVDFTLETRRGPPPSHRLAPDVVARELESAGLVVKTLPVGLPDQYVLEARRAATP